MTLINAMQTEFPVIAPDSPLTAAAGRFAEARYDRLAVVEAGRLVGALDALVVAARAASGDNGILISAAEHWMALPGLTRRRATWPLPC